MGVLDDAIREHLDLKRRRGASDDEIARAEAEALGPPRRAVDGPDDDDDQPDADAAQTRLIEPMEDVAPPPPPRPAPTRAVHDIDEDPLAPPPPVGRAPLHPDDDDEDEDERPLGPGRLSE